MRAAVSVLCMILVVALPAGVCWAHGDHVHVMGTVVKIKPDSITIKTISGDEKTVKLLSTTKFLKSNSTSNFSDLKVGDRVVVHAKANGPALEATEVKTGPTSDSSSPRTAHSH
jgi:hypothetical protein